MKFKYFNVLQTTFKPDTLHIC